MCTGHGLIGAAPFLTERHSALVAATSGVCATAFHAGFLRPLTGKADRHVSFAPQILCSPLVQTIKKC